MKIANGRPHVEIISSLIFSCTEDKNWGKQKCQKELCVEMLSGTGRLPEKRQLLCYCFNVGSYWLFCLWPDCSVAIDLVVRMANSHV